MPDNMNFRNAPDSNRINVNESQEVRYWTQALGCSAEELRDAVSKVGTSIQAVSNYIKGNKGVDNDISRGSRRG